MIIIIIAQLVHSSSITNGSSENVREYTSTLLGVFMIKLFIVHESMAQQCNIII